MGYIFSSLLKVKWGEMPFKRILEDLEKRTSQRVIRADDPWIGQPAGKPIGGLARPMLRGVKKLDFKFTLTMAAYDFIKLPRLIGATA